MAVSGEFQSGIWFKVRTLVTVYALGFTNKVIVWLRMDFKIITTLKDLVTKPLGHSRIYDSSGCVQLNIGLSLSAVLIWTNITTEVMVELTEP